MRAQGTPDEHGTTGERVHDAVQPEVAVARSSSPIARGISCLAARPGELVCSYGPLLLTLAISVVIALVLGQAIGAALAGALIGVVGHLPAFALASAATLGASLLGVARRRAPAHSAPGGPAR